MNISDEHVGPCFRVKERVGYACVCLCEKEKAGHTAQLLQPHRRQPKGRQSLADLCLPLECPRGPQAEGRRRRATAVLQCPPVDRAPPQPPHTPTADGKDRLVPSLCLLSHPPTHTPGPSQPPLLSGAGRAYPKTPLSSQRSGLSGDSATAQLLFWGHSNLSLLDQAWPETSRSHLPWRIPPPRGWSLARSASSSKLP